MIKRKKKREIVTILKKMVTKLKKKIVTKVIKKNGDQTKK